jgi:predicted metal-dependent peptidase
MVATTLFLRKQNLKIIPPKQNLKMNITSDLLGSYMIQKHVFSSRLHSDQMHTSKDQQAYLKKPNKNGKEHISFVECRTKQKLCHVMIQHIQF